ncbi:Tom7-domain-containing protein [Wallemia mellicola CBS 633.66]|uniref:Tom7-domain-containing protein n=1 Tax=Wallemia mellicola (strain ATCC MYA-4683 / CBS 633.66) TaxID=671144 RepID=I4YEU6_WALMC|nr:Tom7-domain-containing protein [Wallemia mellicola CBS 633.66]EIM22488.1 Tom7-domain-containing protein [Wallemia mellicola CBS 633.66]|eukprot:XP_006957728.1 Tom7-domain-containing protein [Wallemia mellicola CBS 633.66]
MLSDDNKERVTKAVEVAKVAAHWGWVPFVIYVGFVNANPKPSLIKLLSPLA